MQLLSGTACRDNNSLPGVLFVRMQFSLCFDGSSEHISQSQSYSKAPFWDLLPQNLKFQVKRKDALFVLVFLLSGWESFQRKWNGIRGKMACCEHERI